MQLFKYIKINLVQKGLDLPRVSKRPRIQSEVNDSEVSSTD